MVSRRNLFSICIMMAVILALFQFSLLVRDIGSNYDTNEHLESAEAAAALGQKDAWAPDGADVPAETVVYIGSGDNASAETVRQWATYTKRQVKEYDSIEVYAQEKVEAAPALVCVAGSEISTEDEVATLRALASSGRSIVFCDLPDVSVMRELSGLRSLLGIQEIAADEVEVEGVELFSGFMLGGSAIYQARTEREEELQDLDLTIPWYLTRHGTKTYMVGLMEDEEIENEELPSIIWRNGYNTAAVFAVLGDYMNDSTGLGILSGVMYEIQDFELYPVVNAQSLSVANFPDFAMENTGEMTEIYARNLRRLQMDVLWPNMIAATSRTGFNMTCFLTPQLDYTGQPELFPGDLTFYLRQFREQGGEAGLSLGHLAGVDLQEKLGQDKRFFEETGSSYTYGAAFIDGGELENLSGVLNDPILQNVKTLTGFREDGYPVLSYFSDQILDQRATADGFNHTYSQDLRVRAVETALGYSNILLDMRHVSWPEEDEAHWERLYESFASNISTYWRSFSTFTKTTISESDARVRTFLTMDYVATRNGDTFSIDVLRTDEHTAVWFLLRMHTDSIVDIDGGFYQQIEEDTYLICAEENHVEITVEEDGDIIYYLS